MIAAAILVAAAALMAGCGADIGPKDSQALTPASTGLAPTIETTPQDAGTQPTVPGFEASTGQQEAASTTSRSFYPLP